jgi:hypothetical protein
VHRKDAVRERRTHRREDGDGQTGLGPRGERPLPILYILSIDVLIERSPATTNQEAASKAETGCFLGRWNMDGQDRPDGWELNRKHVRLLEIIAVALVSTQRICGFHAKAQRRKDKSKHRPNCTEWRWCSVSICAWSKRLSCFAPLRGIVFSSDDYRQILAVTMH